MCDLALYMLDMKFEYLLEQAQNDGFTFDNLSCITGIQSELVSRFATEIEIFWCKEGTEFPFENLSLLESHIKTLSLGFLSKKA